MSSIWKRARHTFDFLLLVLYASIYNLLSIFTYFQSFLFARKERLTLSCFSIGCMSSGFLRGWLKSQSQVWFPDQGPVEISELQPLLPSSGQGGISSSSSS